MKDLIRNILREEVEKNTNIERYLNPLKKYLKCGLICPFVVYWQPYKVVKEPYINIDNTFFTIIQGYNPNILHHLLRYKSFEPYEFMRSIIDSDRYAKISI